MMRAKKTFTKKRHNQHKQTSTQQMNNKIETLFSMGAGGVLAAVRSYQLYDFLTEAAFRGILAILTGFLGAFAGLMAKVLFNRLRDRYFPKQDGKK